VRRTMGGASSRILKVASERFAENGYRGTSIEDIAQGAEISRSSLFWHFRSKEGLLRAVIEETLDAWTTAVAEAGSEVRGVAAMRAGVGAMNRLHCQFPAEVRLMSILMSEASATEPSLIPIFLEMEQAQRRQWTGWFLQAEEDGDLRPGVDPEQAARVVVAATFGMKQLWSLVPEHYDVAGAESALLDLIDGLCQSSPGEKPLLVEPSGPRRMGST
jgi:AcrR family transcriptional regulator